MKIGTKTVSATLTDIKYQVNVNTMKHVAAKKLVLNGIGVCTISLDQSIAFDPYKENQDTGGYILIDRLSNNTVGANKSTIAKLVEKKLYSMGHHTYLLDGDNIRHGLNKDLGFTDADHVENIRPIAVERDVKGLYKKARKGELKNFTGIDSPYEAPENPECRLDITNATPEACADQVIAYMQEKGYI